MNVFEQTKRKPFWQNKYMKWSEASLKEKGKQTIDKVFYIVQTTTPLLMQTTILAGNRRKRLKTTTHFRTWWGVDGAETCHWYCSDRYWPKVCVRLFFLHDWDSPVSYDWVKWFLKYWTQSGNDVWCESSTGGSYFMFSLFLSLLRTMSYAHFMTFYFGIQYQVIHTLNPTRYAARAKKTLPGSEFPAQSSGLRRNESVTTISPKDAWRTCQTYYADGIDWSSERKDGKDQRIRDHDGWERNLGQGGHFIVR